MRREGCEWKERVGRKRKKKKRGELDDDDGEVRMKSEDGTRSTEAGDRDKLGQWRGRRRLIDRKSVV